MLNFLKEILQGPSEGVHQASAQNYELKLQIATCALFLELAHADEEFSLEEEEKIIQIMKETFELNEKYVLDLIELSKEHVNKSVSVYEFTDIVNKNFSFNEKFELVKNLWRLIYADENLSSHEEYFVRKVSGNLHLHHQELIGAKLEVKREMGL